MLPVKTFVVVVSFLVTIILTFDFCSGERALASTRSGFGEFCNDTIKCEKRAMLSCQESVCNCILLDEMVYDTIGKKCVSKVGETCKFGIVDSSRSTDTISLYEITGCVKNSVCSTDGICECIPQFYESFDGSCVPKGLLNQTCNSDVECRYDKFLKCIEGKCDCNPNTALWNHDKGKCVGKAGLQLQDFDACVPGTALNSQGKCVCQPENQQYAGKDGNCYKKKSRHSQCSSDDECVFYYRYLSCVNGTCDCDPNLYGWKEISIRSYWDEQKNGQCVGLAGKQSNQENQCVDYASVSQSQFSHGSSSRTGTCKCSSDYHQTTKGKCGKGHRSRCSIIAGCSDKFMCTNGVCNCPDMKHQIYDESNKKCESVVSGPCQYSSDCVQNATCQYMPDYKYKQCICNLGFVETMEGNCQPAYGTECDYGKQDKIEFQCDTIGNLVCRNGICECPESLSYFDKESRKCLDRVGSRCKNKKSCVPNAICYNLEAHGNPIPGNCKCEKGYVVNEKKLCEQITIELAELKLNSSSTNDENLDNNFMNELAKIIVN